MFLRWVTDDGLDIVDRNLIRVGRSKIEQGRRKEERGKESRIYSRMYVAVIDQHCGRNAEWKAENDCKHK